MKAVFKYKAGALRGWGKRGNPPEKLNDFFHESIGERG